MPSPGSVNRTSLAPAQISTSLLLPQGRLWGNSCRSERGGDEEDRTQYSNDG
jgi:hypothetical protein